MFRAQVKINRPIRVVINTSNKGERWGQIRFDGKILHTGQVGYIKRIAKQRYNTLVEV